MSFRKAQCNSEVRSRYLVVIQERSRNYASLVSRQNSRFLVRGDFIGRIRSKGLRSFSLHLRHNAQGTVIDRRRVATHLTFRLRAFASLTRKQILAPQLTKCAYSAYTHEPETRSHSQTRAKLGTAALEMEI